MKSLTTLLVFALLSATAHAACDYDKASDAADLLLSNKADVEIEVSQQESTEGGEWLIYFDKNKVPQNIQRTDYGEMGRITYRLSPGIAGNFLLSSREESYAVPFTEQGSFTIREAIEHFQFCDGKLDLPQEWSLDSPYAISARNITDFFFTAKEIASYINAAKLKQPIWK